MSKYKRILIVGRPNVGKTSIVNCISGSELKVGNFAGVTTQMHEVMVKKDDTIISLIDSPGVYSLKNISGKDEEILYNYLQNDDYDIVLNIIDSSKVQSDIFLTAELLEVVKKPIILCFNAVDNANKQGFDINTDEIYRKTGIKTIKTDSCSMLKCCNLDIISNIIQNITDKQSYRVTSSDIQDVIMSCVTSVAKVNSTITKITDYLDKILLNKFLSLPIFGSVMYLMFKFVFTVNELSESFFGAISDTSSKILSILTTNYYVSDLIVSGILQGFLLVLQFVPSVVTMLTMINILEKTGYMTRVSFIFDSIMKFFNLNGKAVIPFISGFGCSIPAYISTRILPSKIERMAAMFAIGFMTCSAKFTFFIILIGMIFPAENAVPIMFGIYIISAIIGLTVSAIIAKFLSKVDKSSVVNKNTPIEMPSYKLPNIHSILKYSKCEAVRFVKNNTKIITLSVLFIWILTHISCVEQFNFKHMYTEDISRSILSDLGKIIEPIFKHIGFDWRLSIVVLSGLVGKEVGAATISSLFLGNTEIQSSISQNSCIALITFFALYVPCISAVSVFKTEAEYKYATTALITLTTIIAYIFSAIAYKLSFIFI